MNRPFLSLLTAAVLVSSGPVEAKADKWPCYWLHGRLTAGNGTPSVRIWPRGTNRLLGVVNWKNPHSDVGELGTLPPNVLRLIGINNIATMWGDFFVCPVAPERAGRMRFVIVNHARKLFVQRD